MVDDIPRLSKAGRLVTTEYKDRFADVLNRPVCAAKDATRHFLTGAATPPCKGGEYRP
jgi:hypothetical protein